MMDTNNSNTGSHEQQRLSAILDKNYDLSPTLSLGSNVEDLFDIRNCPTPDMSKLHDLNDFMFPFSFDQFDTNNDEIMSLLNQSNDVLLAKSENELAAADVAFNNADCTGLNAVSQSTIFGAIADDTANNAVHNPLLHQTSSAPLLSSTASPFQAANNSHNFINLHHNNSFVPIDEERIKREENNQTPVISTFNTSAPEMQLVNSGDASRNNNASKNKGGRMKCMSRNAILARQNREKKKSEQESMARKLDHLEEENAGLKKKVQEYKTGMESAQSRVKYLEAVIQNIPQILDVIDHMSHIKSSIPNPKGGGGPPSNSNQT